MQTELTQNENNLNGVAMIKSTQVIYLCGMRGVGKSVLMGELAKEMQNIVIYDGATHQHGDKGTVVRTPEELDAAMKANTGSLRIVCQPWKDGEEVFDKFCAVIWENGNCMFIVEEIGNYLGSHKCGENADQLIRVGRNRGVGIMGLNQRPARIWNNFIAVVDHWFVFRVMLPRDVEFLCEYLGKEKERAIKELPRHYFYYMSSDTMKPIKCNPVKI